MGMKSWSEAVEDGLYPGALASAATSLAAALRGRKDSGSALAPINAPSHVLWGDRATQVERLTVRHTLVGHLINTASGIFWAAIFQKLFGRLVDRRGIEAGVLAGAATAGIAYATDYRVVPKRLTPGWEKRLSKRSLFYVYGALALSLGVGAALQRKD